MFFYLVKVIFTNNERFSIPFHRLVSFTHQDQLYIVFQFISGLIKTECHTLENTAMDLIGMLFLFL